MVRQLASAMMYPLAEKYLGRKIQIKLEALRRHSTLSPDEKLRLLRVRLRNTLEHSGQHVPYYRDLFRSLSFDPALVERDLKFLEKLPFLTKDILREQGRRMVADNFSSQPLHERNTNGSTGLVTKIWYDQNSLDWTAAANLYVSECAGRRLRDTEVHLSTRFVTPIPRKAALIERIKCWSLNRVNLHTENFEESSLLDLLQQLKRVSPYSVQGHPSTLYFLALEARKSNEFNRLFTMFESTGETLEADRANVIETTFGCKVHNRYGNAEFGVVAQSEESATTFHVLDFVVYPESASFDKSDDNSDDNLEEIVLTGLENLAMPLIRYRTGDLGHVEKNANGFILSELTGRIHDLVHVNGKQYPTHFIKDLIERAGDVDEFQIVERGDGRVPLLRIVPGPNFRQDRLDTLFLSYFDCGFEVEIVKLEQLALTGSRKKFRYLVSEPS